jgi:hypothetical protein
MHQLLLDGYTPTPTLAQRVGPSAWVYDAGQGRLPKEFLVLFVTGAAPVQILIFFSRAGEAVILRFLLYRYH